MASEARFRWERLNLIRKEKFDIILPKVMRENQIDMWIHVMREGNPDPLMLDLGGDRGYFIFTDRGGDRIERAVLGGDEEILRETGVYDIFGSEDDLGRFVAERDPKRIAVNMSERWAIADSLSHTSYEKLITALGEKYSRRLVSADQLITDFRTRRIVSEIVEYGHLCEVTRQLIERALSNEVITPGVTTLEDVGWWFADQVQSLGMEPFFAPMFIHFFMPAVMHSDRSSESEYQSRQYIIQRGDLLKYDTGIQFLNLGTDIKRYAYVLQEGEKAIPEGIQRAWDQALRVREIIRGCIKVGQTAGETLELIAKALEENGFVYVHLTQDPSLGGLPTLKPGEYPGKTWVTIDCHCVGNTGNGDIELGPAIASFRQDRVNLVIKPNHLFAFEYVAATEVPEWEGWRFPVNVEDDAIVTQDGVQWLYPPNERILLIR